MTTRASPAFTTSLIPRADYTFNLKISIIQGFKIYYLKAVPDQKTFYREESG